MNYSVFHPPKFLFFHAFKYNLQILTHAIREELLMLHKILTVASHRIPDQRNKISFKNNLYLKVWNECQNGIKKFKFSLVWVRLLSSIKPCISDNRVKNEWTSFLFLEI